MRRNSTTEPRRRPDWQANRPTRFRHSYDSPSAFAAAGLEHSLEDTLDNSYQEARRNEVADDWLSIADQEVNSLIRRHGDRDDAPVQPQECAHKEMELDFS